MNRIALITGASSGIGAALALSMSKNGYLVILVARSESRLNIVSKKIMQEGGKCVVLNVDLVSELEILNLKEKVLCHGVPSVVINNAGYGKFHSLENTEVKEWDYHININLKASFLICKAFVGSMKKAGEGAFVFLNSIAGKKGFSNSSAYVASKFGLRGFADAIREELREYNIKVISIFPGAVNTPFWDNSDISFDKDDMLDVNILSKSILNAIDLPGNCVVEEMLIRRTKGDF